MHLISSPFKTFGEIHNSQIRNSSDGKKQNKNNAVSKSAATVCKLAWYSWPPVNITSNKRKRPLFSRDNKIIKLQCRASVRSTAFKLCPPYFFFLSELVGMVRDGSMSAFSGLWYDWKSCKICITSRWFDSYSWLELCLVSSLWLKSQRFVGWMVLSDLWVFWAALKAREGCAGYNRKALSNCNNSQ